MPTKRGLVKRKLTISAPGARTKPYVKSLSINGVRIEKPIIRHAQLVGWEGKESFEINVVFEMSEKVEMWGNDKEVLDALGVDIPGAEKPEEKEKVLEGYEHDEL